MTSKRRPLLNQAGAVTSSTMIWLFIITVVIYVCYMVVPPYFSYYIMKIEVEREAELAHKFSDEALTANILNKAEAWSVPIALEDIIITRGYEAVDISIKYSTTIDFVPGYSKTFKFYVEVSEPLKDNSGMLY